MHTSKPKARMPTYKQRKTAPSPTPPHTKEAARHPARFTPWELARACHACAGLLLIGSGPHRLQRARLAPWEPRPAAAWLTLRSQGHMYVTRWASQCACAQCHMQWRRECRYGPPTPVKTSTLRCSQEHMVACLSLLHPMAL